MEVVPREAGDADDGLLGFVVVGPTLVGAVVGVDGEDIGAWTPDDGGFAAAAVEGTDFTADNDIGRDSCHDPIIPILLAHGADHSFVSFGGEGASFAGGDHVEEVVHLDGAGDAHIEEAAAESGETFVGRGDANGASGVVVAHCEEGAFDVFDAEFVAEHDGSGVVAVNHHEVDEAFNVGFDIVAQEVDVHGFAALFEGFEGEAVGPFEGAGFDLFEGLVHDDGLDGAGAGEPFFAAVVDDFAGFDKADAVAEAAAEAVGDGIEFGFEGGELGFARGLGGVCAGRGRDEGGEGEGDRPSGEAFHAPLLLLNFWGWTIFSGRGTREGPSV